jgi:hypothetical protein
MDRFDVQPHVANGGHPMDGTDLGRLELVTSSIHGLKRRLPYDFKCRCGRTTPIDKPGRFRFVCLCGLNHSLRDSERDRTRRGVQWPAQSVASLFPRAFVGETEMDALNRFFWNQFDAPAIAYYLIAAIVLVAVLSGIHSLVPA